MSHTFMVELHRSTPDSIDRFTRFIERLGGEAADSGEKLHGEVVMRIHINQDDEEFVRMLVATWQMWRPGTEPKR